MQTHALERLTLALTILAFLAPISSAVESTDAPYFYNKERPLIIAHRGGSIYFPENTIEAAVSAVYQGADFIQIDVALT